MGIAGVGRSLRRHRSKSFCSWRFCSANRLARGGRRGPHEHANLCPRGPSLVVGGCSHLGILELDVTQILTSQISDWVHGCFRRCFRALRRPRPLSADGYSIRTPVRAGSGATRGVPAAVRRAPSTPTSRA